MFKRKRDKDIFSKLEWGTFNFWDEMLEDNVGHKIKYAQIICLKEAIILTCSMELKCDSKSFEKEFNKHNKEFLLFMKKVFQTHGYIDRERGNIVTLKRLLKVPAGIKIYEDKDYKKHY